MSAKEHFINKCYLKVKENVALAIQKLSDPASLVQVDASSSLKEAAKGNFGPLASVASDYLEQNADALLIQALQVTGLENKVLDALNLFYNMLAQAMSAYNDLLLLYLKKLAKNIITEIEAKEEINQALKKHLTALHNGLLAISSGNPVFDKYVADLRKALLDLESGRKNIQLTRNTLKSSGRFLSKPYNLGKSQVESAVSRIKPLDDNPYLSPTAAGVLANVGIQTDKQQINNILAIPVLCKNVIASAQGYDEINVKINSMLVAYYAGLQQLQLGIPDVMKKYILSRFDSTLEKLSNLVRSMALTLNGNETYTGAIAPGYKITPLAVSVLAFKWAMDGTLVQESFKLIPAGHVVVSRRANGQARPASPENKGRRLVAAQSDDFKSVRVGDTVTIFSIPSKNQEYKVREVISGAEIELDRVVNNTIVPKLGIDYEITSDALGALQLNFAVVDAYLFSVKNLKTLDSTSSGTAALIATDAQENFALFAGQLLTFLLEATAASVNGKMRPASLSQCRAFIKRCDLVTSRGEEIKTHLLRFVNTPIPLEDTLLRIQDGLAAALSGMGLDRAAVLLETGEYSKFFKLNSKNATYAGAALEAIAFLKDCFDNETDRNRLSEIENDVRGDAELINFKISFNFDLAIFKNLEDCVNLKALANLFSTKEILCGLLEQAGIGTLFNKLDDLLSF